MIPTNSSSKDGKYFIHIQDTSNAQYQKSKPRAECEVIVLVDEVVPLRYQ